MWDRWRQRAARLEDAFLALLLLVILAMIVIQVGSRLVGTPVRWTQEVGRFALVWLAFAGAAAAIRTNEHVAFELLVDMLERRPSLRRAVHWVVVGATVGLMATLLVTGILWVAETRRMGLRAVTIDLPTYAVGAAIPVSALLSLVHAVRRARPVPRPQEDAEPRPAVGVR